MIFKYALYNLLMAIHVPDTRIADKKTHVSLLSLNSRLSCTTDLIRPIKVGAGPENNGAIILKKYSALVFD
ncbi:MAG: hypothetical protein WAT34_07320 [Chitinophagaceae bacterium]